MADFTVESRAFDHAEPIPSRHTCLEQAIAGHVLTTAELVGTYER